MSGSNEEYSKDLFSFCYHSSNAPCSAYFLDLHAHLLLICSFAHLLSRAYHYPEFVLITQ